MSSEIPPGTDNKPIPTLEELYSSHVALQFWFHLLVVLLIIFVGGLSVYLLREVTSARRQIKDLTQFVQNYEKNSLPVMLEFRTKLYDFAKRNPDFMTIFSRYFNPTSAPAAAPPSSLDTNIPRLAPSVPPQ